MPTIKDIIQEKGGEVHFVKPGTDLRTALGVMADKGVGALVVLDGAGIQGIFSERDFARKTLTLPNFNLDLPVDALMTSPVIYADPSQSIETCMTIMTEKRVRHLPVVENGDMIGLVSIRDVIDWLIAMKKVEISELERFVESSPEGDE